MTTNANERLTPVSANAACIKSIEPDPQSVANAVEDTVSAVGRKPASGSTWAVKLNLTYPTYLPGVVNSPVFVEGLCRWARDNSIELQLLEGDGGNGAYMAEDAFNGNGIIAIARKYGVKCVSISEKPWVWRETVIGGRSVRLPYSPFFERRDFDVFVTAPLFKNHIFTTVSLGMKNLWGCIPDAYRMYYHHVLDAGIVALQKELAPDFSIFDGHIALRGAGPIDGSAFEFNTVMASSDVGTGELAALELMGIDIHRVRHLEIARSERIVPEAVKWLTDPTPFRRSDFILERTLVNYLSIYAGKSPRLQQAVYHSRVSAFIYAIIDRLRPRSAQAELVRAKKAGKYQAVEMHDREHDGRNG